MANENLLFRKGTLKELSNAELIAGSINFTTDEPAIYLDIQSGENVVRKRIGDLIIVDTLDELMLKGDDNKYDYNSKATNALVGKWSTQALYYVTNNNALLKWNEKSDQTGGYWTQINSGNGDLEGELPNIQTAIATIQETINNDIYKKNEVDNLLSVKANSSDLDAKADKTDLNDYVTNSTYQGMVTEVSTIKNDYVTKNEKAALEAGISEAKASASAADQKAANAQKEVDALETVVEALSSDLTNFGTNVANTYETKQDANLKQTNLSNAITNLQNGEVKTNAENITKEEERATAAENVLDGKITALNTTVTNLSTNTAQAISDLKGAAQDTEDAITVYGAKAYAKFYADSAIETALASADAMTFKGVVGTNAGYISLPSSADDVKAGDTYKVGEQGNYLISQEKEDDETTKGYETCYVGDLLIAKEDGKIEYYHITSGYEDNYDTKLGVNAESNKIRLNNPVGQEVGSVIFKTNEDSSLSVSTTGEEDTNGIANSTVTFSLTWGSFGSEE